MAVPPAVAASLAFVAGAGLGAWLPQEPGAWGWATLAALAAWAAALGAGRRRAATRLGLATFAIVGIFRCQSDLAALSAGDGPIAEGDAVVAGRVGRPAEQRDGETVLHLDDVRLRRSGETARLALPLQVVIDGAAGGIAVGDLVVARGRVREIRGDRNLGWFPGPVAPLSRRYAARLAVASPVWVRLAGHAPGSGPRAAVLRWRAAADAFWKRRPGAAGEILNALTTGERAGIPREVQEDFLRSGLTHLLAISGMNVGFLAALVLVLLRWGWGLVEPLALRVPAQPAAAVLTIPALWFFLLFSGSQIPVGRAVLMCGVALVAVLLWRRLSPGSACAFAALVVVARDPRALFTASFQLSFAAVAALLIVATRLAGAPADAPENWRERLWKGARSLTMASLAATAATAPLVAFHFQQVSLVGPVANLVAVPFAGFLVLPAAWVALAVAAASPAAGDAAARVAGLGAEGLVWLASVFGAPPWSVVRTARPPLLATACLLVLAFTLLPKTSGRLAWGRAWACAAAACACTLWALGTHRAELLIAVFDVGQGLSAVAVAPGGRALLFDAGPRWRNYDAGERVVVPALRRLGLWRLDTLAISHPHPDHAGGAASVRRLMGGAGRGSAPSLLETTWTGEREYGGGVRLRSLNAEAGSRERGGADDVNDRSLALLLALGETGIVLTGDVGPRVAARLAAASQPHPPRLLLQAPHHGGSPAACRLLASGLRPEIVVIPVGRNTYGHPHPDAEAALATGSRVLRSDREGAVFALSNGRGFAVRTWRELSSGRTWRERVRWLVAGW